MSLARRYNKDKLRYELIPERALSKIAEVYTKGAEKYTIRDENGNIIDDGANNWRKGLSWMDMIASVERHIRAFKSGEDIDPDLNTFHLANASWGLMSLLEYYSIFPQGDDRQHQYLNHPRIGLDIDGVLADWVGAYKEKYNYDKDHNFASWYLHYDIIDRCVNDLDNEHYLNLKPLISATELPFEPHCYITARHHTREETTKKWLYNNGFPCVPVYLTNPTHNKVEIAKASGVEVFVDDVYKNFVELNNAGICTYLFTTPYNIRYNVGHKRINSLKDLPWFK